ncbi:MAG: cysteine desulfurase/selenocysteine lyase [Saprospiraceae bacterium]|jgi:cysteine desulfurase/selenocysteine lyase
MLNINQVRKDTPHCQNKLFFNSAGASLVPSIVTERMKTYLDEEAELGGYKLGLGNRIQSELQEFYAETSKMLNCKPRNVAFSINATDAYGQVLSAIPFEKGDVIITTDDDYTSNHAQFSVLYQRFRVATVRVRNLANGDIDLTHMQELIKEHHPKLVSVSHIPTNSGKIQNVEAIGDLCSENDVLYIIDACQSAGQMPLDVQKLKCDFLCSSGRKFLRGPRATGFLYVSDKAVADNLIPIRVDGRGMEWVAAKKFKAVDNALRFETWEQNVACVLGLKEAIRYANNIGLDNIWNYNQDILSYLRNKLFEVPGMKILDQGSQLASILTFQIKNKDRQHTINTLEQNNIYFSVAFRGAALIDFDKKGTDWAIRLAPHYFNTHGEIDQLVDIIRSI